MQLCENGDTNPQVISCNSAPIENLLYLKQALKHFGTNVVKAVFTVMSGAVQKEFTATSMFRPQRNAVRLSAFYVIPAKVTSFLRRQESLWN